MLLLETNKIVYKSVTDNLLVCHVGYYAHILRTNNPPFFIAKNYDQATYTKLVSIYDLENITLWKYYELTIHRNK